MEELVLTDPIVVPAKTTDKYKVIRLNLDWLGKAPTATVAGLAVITLQDNNGEVTTYHYEGQQAVDFIKFINTGNFSVNSLHKRILQKLSTDGLLPGTVTGAPDP